MNKIIYEDNHLLVAVKPAGIPVQADSSGDDDFLSQLKRYIGKKYNKPGAVYLGLLHRLDRPASGVMVFARTSKAASRLTSQFKKGSIGQYSLAVVEGIPPESGKLRDFLLKDHERNIVRTCASGTPNAKEAILEYRRLAVCGGRSLVRIKLGTGRSHQIRVQFSSRGFPLVGDRKYGKSSAGDLALFSHRLELTHPTTKEQMAFYALPEGGAFAQFDLNGFSDII
ncbi:MAG: RluA family pseudouridine synthase [Christensenellaceae bacterium]